MGKGCCVWQCPLQPPSKGLSALCSPHVPFGIPRHSFTCPSPYTSLSTLLTVSEVLVMHAPYHSQYKVEVSRPQGCPLQTYTPGEHTDVHATYSTYSVSGPSKGVTIHLLVYRARYLSCYVNCCEIVRNLSVITAVEESDGRDSSVVRRPIEIVSNPRHNQGRTVRRPLNGMGLKGKVAPP